MTQEQITEIEKTHPVTVWKVCNCLREGLRSSFIRPGLQYQLGVPTVGWENTPGVIAFDSEIRAVSWAIRVRRDIVLECRADTTTGNVTMCYPWTDSDYESIMQFYTQRCSDSHHLTYIPLGTVACHSLIPVRWIPPSMDNSGYQEENRSYLRNMEFLHDRGSLPADILQAYEKWLEGSRG